MASKKAPTPRTTPPVTAASVDSDKAVWVCERLDAAYGSVLWRSHGEPMATLVVTMLSQHTSDRNCERAFDDLRRRFPTWDDVRTAPVGEIADAIRAGGLADSKAPRIRRVLEEIYAAHGSDDLSFLRDLPVEEARTYLTGFNGVGPKTAACVLMFSLGKPVLPVDTHVFRVSHRLGLIDRAIGEAKAHDALQSQLPPDRVYSFHVHLIRHGRRVCTARQPRCEACVLRSRCDYYQSGGREKGDSTAKTGAPDAEPAEIYVEN
jgi:endonuclease-3